MFTLLLISLPVALGLSLPDGLGGLEALGVDGAGCSSTVRHGYLFGALTVLADSNTYTFQECVDAVIAEADGADGVAWQEGYSFPGMGTFPGQCYKVASGSGMIVLHNRSMYTCTLVSLPPVPTAPSCAGNILPGSPRDQTTESNAGTMASLEACAAHGVTAGASAVSWVPTDGTCYTYTDGNGMYLATGRWGCFLPSYHTQWQAVCQDQIHHSGSGASGSMPLSNSDPQSVTSLTACANAVYAQWGHEGISYEQGQWCSMLNSVAGPEYGYNNPQMPTWCRTSGVCGGSVGGDAFRDGTGHCDLSHALPGHFADLNACVAAAQGMALVDGVRVSDAGECEVCMGFRFHTGYPDSEERTWDHCMLGQSTTPNYAVEFVSSSCSGTTTVGDLDGTATLVGQFASFEACVAAVGGSSAKYVNSAEGTNADCYAVSGATVATASLEYVSCLVVGGSVVGDPDFIPLFGGEKHMFHVVLKRDVGVYNLVTDRDFLLNTQIFSAFDSNGHYLNQWMEKLFFQYNTTRVEVTNSRVVFVNGIQLMGSEVTVDGVHVLRSSGQGQVHITLPSRVVWQVQARAISENLRRPGKVHTAAGVVSALEAEMVKLEVTLLKGKKSDFSRCVSGLIGYAARFTNLDLVEKMFPGSAEDFAVAGSWSPVAGKLC